MSFVRVTYVVPREGQVERVREQLKKLSDYYATQPGYIEGYLLNPHVKVVDYLTFFHLRGDPRGDQSV